MSVAMEMTLSSETIQVHVSPGLPGSPLSSAMSGWGDLFDNKYEEVLDQSTGEMIMVHATHCRAYSGPSPLPSCRMYVRRERERVVGVLERVVSVLVRLADAPSR